MLLRAFCLFPRAHIRHRNALSQQGRFYLFNPLLISEGHFFFQLGSNMQHFLLKAGRSEKFSSVCYNHLVPKPRISWLLTTLGIGLLTFVAVFLFVIKILQVWGKTTECFCLLDLKATSLKARCQNCLLFLGTVSRLTWAAHGESTYLAYLAIHHIFSMYWSSNISFVKGHLFLISYDVLNELIYYRFTLWGTGE